MRSVAFIALSLALALSACASNPQLQARTWLDERTAVTVTAQESPATFAREEQMRAMNVRDYADIGAIEINRMGTRSYYLLLISWSTIDRTATEREAIEGALARITLWADDRPIELTREPATGSSVGLSRRPYILPTPAAVESWYPLTLAELRSLAAADALRLSAKAATGDERRYSEWRSDRRGLASFLEYISQPH